jgi:hypothetical protein
MQAEEAALKQRHQHPPQMSPYVHHPKDSSQNNSHMVPQRTSIKLHPERRQGGSSVPGPVSIIQDPHYMNMRTDGQSMTSQQRSPAKFMSKIGEQEKFEASY